MLWWWLTIFAAATAATTTTPTPKAHTLQCPLGVNGPDASVNFFPQPQNRPATVAGGRCGARGFDAGEMTCCMEDYFAKAEGSEKTDPFYLSASLLFLSDPSGMCSEGLGDVSCGVCRSHQDGFVQNHTSLSEFRVCLSFCQNLLVSCASEALSTDDTAGLLVSDNYGSDAAGFCYDLFGNVENVKVSVVDDDSSIRQCFSSAPECTSSDFVSFYTECDLEQTSRSVYFDFVEGSECRGGEPLPDPIGDLTCHQTCLAGEYLPVGERDCQKCAAGTHTVPGFYNDLWKDWPAEFNFDTYCENNTGYTYVGADRIDEGPCQGWILNDTFTESGEAVENSQQSVLEFSAYLVTDGYVEFEYKVLSEPRFDGLLFLVDSDLVMKLQSQVLDWKVFRYDLKAGQHNLKWIYFKDRVFSSSLDMAMLDKITIIGTKWADNECDPCSFGHYSEEGWEFCAKCPMNTYADSDGLSECLECGPSEFSGVGASSCLPRHDCTEADYTAAYGPCDGTSRVKYYQLNEPILCNYPDFTLPPNETIDCGDCNPGMYRPESSRDCEYCPSGYHTSEPGAVGSCDACEPGTYARKAQQYTVFESWDDLPLTPSCSGDCANEVGWRLQFSSIDSGVGHGEIVDLSLEMEFTTESVGVVEWVYSVVCGHLCWYQTVDVGVSGGTRTYYASQFTQGVYTATHPIYKVGDHVFRWTFIKDAEVGLVGLPEDRLIIHNITITGVNAGGSISCESCRAGTYSGEAAEFCTECLAGQYSEDGALECSDCPEGTFSKEEGASSCAECGPNTVSFEDGTGCDYNGCSFDVDMDESKIVYDISALEVPVGQDIYGPVVDRNDHVYYLNPCTTKHNNNSCIDSQGVPFETHACQLLGSPFDHYVDLGHVQGFLPLEDTSLAEDPLRSGFVLTSSSGDPGPECGNRPRGTNITFLCNPSAGIGTPVGVEPVESPPCFYNFQWASLYACPVCSMDDYVATYGQCSGGVQLLTYLPKTYPSRCHDGQGPPAPQTVPCESTKVDCPPGKYLPFLANECSLVPAGHYSIGGGVVIETFLEDFLPPIIDSSSTWGLLGDFVRSGAGDTTFTINVFLVQAGYVTFEYKVVAPGLDPAFESGFTFLIDGVSLHNIKRYSTDYKYEVFTLPLRSGDHTLEWKFVQGSLPSREERGNYAIIDYINIYGTDRAARAPVPCKSGFYQELEGQDSCKPCGTDSKSDAGSASCAPCSEDHFSIPGSSECEIRQPCEQTDFVVRYTECDEENKRFMYYVPHEPQTCQLTRSDLFDDNGTDVECASCPEGYLTEEGNCTPCPRGNFWEDGVCVAAPAGSRTKLVRKYVPLEGAPISSPQNEEERQEREEEEEEEEETPWWAAYSSDLPDGFTTFSTGELGSTGWRIGNNSLDSGFHAAAEADSVLALNVTLVQPGSISFSYELEPHSEVSVDADNFFLDGLEFSIDGKLQDSVFYHPLEYTKHTASFELELDSEEPKDFLFEWVYHQPAASPRHNTVILWEVEVFGDRTGTSFESVECLSGTAAPESSFVCSSCPPGHFSATSGADECTFCEAGFFADESGQSSCQECGKGTLSSTDATVCDLSGCVFTTPEDPPRAYDLSGLSPFVEFEDPDSTGFRYELSLCEKIPPLMTNCFVGESPLNTFSCAKNKSTGASFSTGNLANVGFTHDDVESPFPQLMMRYDHGAPCRGSNYFTEISFICDPNVTESSQGIEFVGQFECRTEVEWRNIAGCPVCQESDYKKQITECQDSQQSITWIKSNNCNGREILKEETQTCHDYTLPIAVLSLGVFVLLIFAIIVIVIRNKKLAERYEMLVHESTRRGSGPAEKSNPGWENDNDNEKL